MILYAVDRSRDVLVVAGKATESGNHLRLVFAEPAINGIAEGHLRPFVLVAARALQDFPTIPPDVASRPVETVIFGAPRGKRPDHRPVVWRGWPIEGRRLLLLRPEVPVAKLPTFELKQDGFADRRAPDGSLYPEPKRQTAQDRTRSRARAREAPEEPSAPPARPPAPSSPPAPPRGRPGLTHAPDCDMDEDCDCEPAYDPEDVPRPGPPGDLHLRAGRRHTDARAPVRATWGEQVAWIRARHAEGVDLEDVALRIALPMASVRAALTWEPPAKPKRRKKRPPQPRQPVAPRPAPMQPGRATREGVPVAASPGGVRRPAAAGPQ